MCRSDFLLSNTRVTVMTAARQHGGIAPLVHYSENVRLFNDTFGSCYWTACICRVVNNLRILLSGHKVEGSGHGLF